MMLLLSLFFLFYQANDLPAAKLSAVDFSAVKQGPVKNPGCIPLFSRQITFRVKNQSDKTIYIYGQKSDDYYPLGYLIRLDREKNQWLNPVYNLSPRPYKDFMSQAPVAYVPDVYVLPPGRSMKFKDLAKETDLGSQVKRFIYISFSRDEEPQIMTSEEFTLR
jgi:hypothetical protein